MIRMRAQRCFRVGPKGAIVQPGGEFTVAETRARDYERSGMAVRLADPEKPAVPFASSRTGAAKPASSSAPAHRPRKRRSRSPKAAPAS